MPQEENEARQTKQAKHSKKTKDMGAELNAELFESLRLLRNRIAADQRVPAYIVFSDATLWDMCRKLPMNRIDFMKVNGVGQAKLERYGEMFIDKIRSGA